MLKYVSLAGIELSVWFVLKWISQRLQCASLAFVETVCFVLTCVIVTSVEVSQASVEVSQACVELCRSGPFK